MKVIKSILKFFREWDEWWTIPFAIVAFLCSPYLFRIYDSTAGSYDVGILQKVFLAFLILLIANGVAYLMTFLNNRNSYNILDTTENLSAWEKAKIARWRWYSYFFAFILLLAMMK